MALRGKSERPRYYSRQGEPMDMMEWAQAFENADHATRIVAKTTVGDADVSTVWLGLDHQWGDGPPLIFGTMVFGGEYDEWQWRYSTEAEAEAGHEQVVVALQNGQDLDFDG